MDTLQVLVMVVQGLMALIGAAFAWWVQRQVGRVDRQEERLGGLSERLAVQESTISTAPTAETIRGVIREELDRAVGPIHRDLDDVRTRLRAVEERKGRGE